MITISCPDNNVEERAYVIDIIVGEFLGLTYLLEPSSDVTDYHLLLNNGNEIIIRDRFFSKFQKNLSYLLYENLPQKVIYIENPCLAEKDLPIIYGTTELEMNNRSGGSSQITCGIDLFASSFLMLTRWEEYVSPVKDHMGRFSAKNSIAHRFGFLNRPVVNEYTEFLWNMLIALGLDQSRKTRVFTPYLTHDVDYILKWYNLGSFLRAVVGDLVKRKSLKALIRDTQSFIRTRLMHAKDPFDTFDRLMSMSEQHGLKSYFFMMSVDSKKQRYHYRLSHPFVRNLLDDIEKRGHFIGIHPDLNTYKNKEKWRSELERLRSHSNSRVSFGRQHYLQFEAPATWQIWEEMGMEWDSSVSYDEAPGFRTGSCYSFSVFNFLTRKKLSLKERSLIIMDKALVMQSDQKNRDQMDIFSRDLVDRVKFYEGEFVFLWHNSSFNVPEWKPFETIYSNILELLGDSD